MPTSVHNTVVVFVVAVVDRSLFAYCVVVAVIVSVPLFFLLSLL